MGDYLFCQTFGHSWENRTEPQRFTKHNEIMLRCVNCGTERDDHVDIYGRVMWRAYRRPSDYKVPKGTTRADQRIEYINKNAKGRRRRG